jgi:hypothetical protein
MMDKGKGWWLLGVMAVIVISAAAVSLANTQKTTKRSASQLGTAFVANETDTDDGYDTKIFGVVKGVDEIEGTVTIYDTEAAIDRTLSYTGATRVIDRYDKDRLMSWLSLGELVDAYYYQSSYRLVKIEVNKEAWEYSGISRFQFDTSKQRVTIAGTLYSYESDLYMTGAGEELDFIDLNTRDELMMKGIGKRVYSVIVTKGHGYIRLANYSAFLGGTIEVGGSINLSVVEDMLIAVREGTYQVTMANGELTGTKEVTIERDEEYKLDMGEFHISEDRTAKAAFMIDPEEATLYLNGIATDYSKKVKLNYGDYQIRVEKEGYTAFEGTLTIEESSPIICISLSVDGTSTDGTTDGVTITSSDDTSSTGSGTNSSGTNTTNSDNTNSDGTTTTNSDSTTENSTGTTGSDTSSDTTSTDSQTTGVTSALIDEDHMVTISAPAGAKVYWNGAYKGTVPVTFAKEIGTHVITFSQTGYLTKSYSCEISDDNSDVTLNFPDMVKKETN